MFQYNEFYVTNYLFFFIKKKIQIYEKISFSNYMYLYLYTYKLGYYENKLVKFGSSGDYVTASELGDIFPMCVSRQIQKVAFFIRDCYIVEYGAGTGRLSLKIIKELTYLNVVFSGYIIVEKSSYLRFQQKNLLKNYIKKYNILWFAEIKKKINAIFILNEVLDALPVDCFFYNNGVIFEYFVTYVNNSFEFIANKANKFFKNLVGCKKRYFTVDLYISELNLNMKYLLFKLYKKTNIGYFMFFDYGYLEHIYYADDRANGTLLCHYKHQTNTDFFIKYGLQDLTTHIDFTYVINNSLRIGFNFLEYITLAKFLYNCDLLNIIILLNQDKGINLNLAQELNLLFSPSSMGEIFKVLYLSKNLNLKLL